MSNERREWLVKKPGGWQERVSAKSAAILPNGCLIFDGLILPGNSDGPVGAGAGFAPGDWLSFRPVDAVES